MPKKCKYLGAEINENLSLQVAICHWSEAIKWTVGYLSVKFRDVTMWEKGMS